MSDLDIKINLVNMTNLGLWTIWIKESATNIAIYQICPLLVFSVNHVAGKSGDRQISLHSFLLRPSGLEIVILTLNMDGILNTGNVQGNLHI